MLSVPIDVLVLTPLPQELAALRAELGEAADEGATPEFSYAVWRSLALKDQDQPGSLVAVMPLEKDQIPAGNTTHLALNTWSPRCFALMGIAGQLSDKVNLGDVIVGRHVLQWDAKRKEGLRASGDPHNEYSLTPAPSAKWGASLANLFKSDTPRYEAWRAQCAESRPAEVEGATPELHVDDIASGSATIDSQELKEMLSSLSRYLYAVETEAAAALTAYHSRNPSPLSLLVRGISDPAASKRESDQVGQGAWRRYAAQNAAKLLLLLLRTYRLTGDPHEAMRSTLPSPPSSAEQPQAEHAAVDRIQQQYSALIDERTKSFIGRTYVFEEVERFVDAEKNGYLVIRGDPGEGKTSILAKFVQQRQCLAHFNIRPEGLNRLSHFLASISQQLIRGFGLPHTSLPRDATSSGAYLAGLLSDAASVLKPDERLIIAVDALDEVDLRGHAPGANVLYLPAVLPEKVYFVLTSRRGELRLQTTTALKMLDLASYGDETREDMKEYVRREAARPHTRAWIDNQGVTLPEAIDLLTQKSENNFMYLTYVLRDIDRGLYGDIRLDTLPLGLRQYYLTHWERMGMTASPAPLDKLKVIYLLAEVRRPVSATLLAEFSRQTQVHVQSILDEWSQFLHVQTLSNQKRYSLYHSSFVEFLQESEVVKAAGLSIKGINTVIADDLWTSIHGST
jgi:nucleoside phosphorylase